jgi:crotonobetainyl-CoA hydratase
MAAPLHVTEAGGILEIILDRPKANAIDAVTSREMGKVFVRFRDDPALRVAIITGAGEKIFSAGWDLKAAASGDLSEDSDYGLGGFAGLTELFDLDKPVIAAVNGLAIGGGFELAMACDLIVAAEHAAFALPETQVGVAADSGGLQRLPRQLPYRVALELLLLGRRMPAAEALHHGLINAVVPADQMMRQARDWASMIVDGAPLSVRAIKEVLRDSEKMSVAEAFRAIRARRFPVHDAMLRSEDHTEGPRAFAEKRKPVWKGC